MMSLPGYFINITSPVFSFSFTALLVLPPLLSFSPILSFPPSCPHTSHPFISHSAILSLSLPPSPCRPPPPLLHFSSLLSSAPYCSINLSGRRSISVPRLLFFPSLSAPLFSLSSPSPCLQQDPF